MVQDYQKLGRAGEISGRRDRYTYRFFEMLPGILAWLTLGLIILFSFTLPVFIAFFIILFDIYWLIKTIYLSLHLRAAFKIVKEFMRIDWFAKLSQFRNWQDIYHLIILPMYNEDPSVAAASFEGLIRSNYPKTKMIVVLALEERAGIKSQQVAEYIKQNYADNFFKFLITIHPADIKGEVAKGGKLKKKGLIPPEYRNNPTLRSYYERFLEVADSMTEGARKAALSDLERLLYTRPEAPDFGIFRNHLDFNLTLPWRRFDKENENIAEVKKILNEDHHGLEEVKDKILEYLAARILKQDRKGNILCFVGPPGVGKTSLGKSIARALDLKFIRISLGGIRDEADIRGHRVTYIGATAGKVLNEIKKSGSSNPVFMLDEIDKVGADFRGDPSSALLEVLDPEQNNSFTDHYLDAPFDLSRVFFITTANVTHTVPPPLLDRMDVVKLAGYIETEKLEIAKKFLVPRRKSESGLDKCEISFDDDAILEIIRVYTHEAGVRNLEREIGDICNKTAFQYLSENRKEFQITKDSLITLLGPPKYFIEKALDNSNSGIAVGLAWTEYGGILYLNQIWD